MHYTYTNTDEDWSGLFTAARLYDHLRLKDPASAETPADSSLIDVYVLTAIDIVERYTSIPLLPKTVTMGYDQKNPMLGGYLLKFLTDLSSPSITSIKYRDEDGVLQTHDVAKAYINNIVTPNEVKFLPDQDLPDGATDIEIIYSIATPRYPKQAIGAVLVIAAHLYENRSTEMAVEFNEYKSILNAIKIPFHP